jgi:iron only hydrogenase large subunit-like protein
MPCYDKKLEAVRDDFTLSVDGKEITEVDLVLTTGEVFHSAPVLKYRIINLGYNLFDCYFCLQTLANLFQPHVLKRNPFNDHLLSVYYLNVP